MNHADSNLQFFPELLYHGRSQHVLRNLNEERNARSGDEGFHSIEECVAAVRTGGFDLHALSGEFGQKNVGEWKWRQCDRHAKVASGNPPAITVPGGPVEIQIIVAGSELTLSAVSLDAAAQKAQVWKKAAETGRHSGD